MGLAFVLVAVVLVVVASAVLARSRGRRATLSGLVARGWVHDRGDDPALARALSADRVHDAVRGAAADGTPLVLVTYRYRARETDDDGTFSRTGVVLPTPAHGAPPPGTTARLLPDGRSLLTLAGDHHHSKVPAGRKRIELLLRGADGWLDAASSGEAVHLRPREARRHAELKAWAAARGLTYAPGDVAGVERLGLARVHETVHPADAADPAWVLVTFASGDAGDLDRGLVLRAPARAAHPSPNVVVRPLEQGWVLLQRDWNPARATGGLTRDQAEWLLTAAGHPPRRRPPTA